MTKRDIRVTGAEKSMGGEYGRINVTGSAKFMGDVTAEDVTITGMAKFEKNLETGRLIVSGSLKSDGDIKGDHMTVNGMLKSDRGVIYANQITVNGSLDNDGEINADRIRINGKVKGNQMMGDDIEIAQGFNLTQLIIRTAPANKLVNIECTTLKASVLKCDTISANEITLTNHCKVNTVICDGLLVVDSTCDVMNIEGDCRIERI